MRRASRRHRAGTAALALVVCLAGGAASVQAAGASTRADATPGTSTARAATRTATAAAALAGMAVGPMAVRVPSRGGATLPPRITTGDLSGRTIVVDPGHNGVYRKAVNTRQVPAGNGRRKACNSSGTATGAGFAEHSFTWKAAVQLVAELRARGATVVLTRPDDGGTGPCVDERAAIGNRAAADLVVSIHADGDFARGARGYHIIVSKAMAGGAAVQARSKALALALRKRVTAQTGMPRSTYIGNGTALSFRSDIAGLNLSRVPAVMLEAGNMRNPKDVALLTSASFRTRLAEALADGVVAALKG